jgi:hypothetical protein
MKERVRVASGHARGDRDRERSAELAGGVQQPGCESGLVLGDAPLALPAHQPIPVLLNPGLEIPNELNTRSPPQSTATRALTHGSCLASRSVRR